MGDIQLYGECRGSLPAPRATSLDGEFASGTYSSSQAAAPSPATSSKLRLPPGGICPAKDFNGCSERQRKRSAATAKSRIVGDVGDGRASVTVTNYQGDIKFLHR
jgi:hypothetical protein